MTKEVTFTPEALQAVIAEAVAVALAAREAKPVPKNTLVAQRCRSTLIAGLIDQSVSAPLAEMLAAFSPQQSENIYVDYDHQRIFQRDPIQTGTPATSSFDPG